MKSEYTSAWESPGFLLWHATMRWQRAMRAALQPHDLTHVQFAHLAFGLVARGPGRLSSGGWRSTQAPMR